MLGGSSLLPFRHVFVGFALAVAATAVFAAACVVVPVVILRAKLRGQARV